MQLSRRSRAVISSGLVRVGRIRHATAAAAATVMAAAAPVLYDCCCGCHRRRAVSAATEAADDAGCCQPPPSTVKRVDLSHADRGRERKRNGEDRCRAAVGQPSASTCPGAHHGRARRAGWRDVAVVVLVLVAVVVSCLFPSSARNGPYDQRGVPNDGRGD